MKAASAGKMYVCFRKFMHNFLDRNYESVCRIDEIEGMYE